MSEAQPNAIVTYGVTKGRGNLEMLADVLERVNRSVGFLVGLYKRREPRTNQ